MTVITDTDIQSVALASSVTMSANQSCVKTAINASGSAPIYACRAWVNFNGTTGSGVGHSDITINASGNVSSITDNGTGDYTVNFTTAMPDGNYALSGSGSANNGGNISLAGSTTSITLKSATQVKILSRQASDGITYDMANISVLIIR